MLSLVCKYFLVVFPAVSRIPVYVLYRIPLYRFKKRVTRYFVIICSPEYRYSSLYAGIRYWALYTDLYRHEWYIRICHTDGSRADGVKVQVRMLKTHPLLYETYLIITPPWPGLWQVYNHYGIPHICKCLYYLESV